MGEQDKTGRMPLRERGEFTMTRYNCSALIFGSILFGFLGMAHAADKYPTRAIELVVPFNPEGLPTHPTAYESVFYAMGG